MPVQLSERTQAPFTRTLIGLFEHTEKIFSKGSGVLSLGGSPSIENELFPQIQLTRMSLTQLHSTSKGEIGMQK